MSLSNRRFLYCQDCNAVHRVTPFDSAPVYETEGAELREIPRDDRRDFFDRHVGHGMGELIAIDDRPHEPDGFVDPMRVNCCVVTDGRQNFVLRSFRTSIAESLTYEVLPRQLALWDFTEELPTKPGKAANRDSRPRYRSSDARKKAESRAFETIELAL